MNELCRPYQALLPLYVEGEMEDASLVSRLRAHVLSCEECAEWVEEYREFTREIQSDPGLASPRAAAPSFSARLDGSADEAGRSDRIDRIMSAVRAAPGPGRGLSRVVLGFSRARVLRWSVAAAALLLICLGVVISRSPGSSGRDLPGDLASRSATAGWTGQPAPIETAPHDGSAIPPVEYELVSWIVDGDAPASMSAAAGNVRLLGLVRSFRREANGRWQEVAAAPSDLALRWVLSARLRETFLDPLGGGWTYLAPARVTPRAPEPLTPDHRMAVPVRRVHVRPSSGREADRLLSLVRDPGRLRGAGYRIIVVPEAAPVAAAPLSPLDPAPASPPPAVRRLRVVQGLGPTLDAHGPIPGVLSLDKTY